MQRTKPPVAEPPFKPGGVMLVTTGEAVFAKRALKAWPSVVP